MPDEELPGRRRRTADAPGIQEAEIPVFLRRRDLGDVAGTWIEDPQVDAALADQRQIDEDLWT